MSKQTPLYPIFKEKYQAQFVDFGGWDMPLRFSSVLEEHQAVRTQVGIFDVSHMGNFILQGEDACVSMNYLISNDLGKLSPGQAVYTPMLYPNGSFVDDIIVYLRSTQLIWIVVNAANIEKDFQWIEGHIEKQGFSAQLRDVSNENCLLAIQGKDSAQVISQLFPEHNQTHPFHFSLTDYEGQEIMVANTGYTGETGVEVWCGNSVAPQLFEKAVALGATPCGLGARDSLRLEKGYSLYGHEITDQTNALEAGLGWTVSLSKDDFIGKVAIEKIKTEGLKRRLVGLVMEGKAIPRTGYSVYESDDNSGEAIGEVTSGGYSPTLKKNIALAYIPKSYKLEQVYVDIRGRLFPAQVHKRVFC